MASIPWPKELPRLLVMAQPRPTQARTVLATRWSRYPVSPRPWHLLDYAGRQPPSPRRSLFLLRVTVTFPIVVARNAKPRRHRHPRAKSPDNRARKGAIESGMLAAAVASTNILIAGSPARMIDIEGASRLGGFRSSAPSLPHILTISFRWATISSALGLLAEAAARFPSWGKPWCSWRYAAWPASLCRGWVRGRPLSRRHRTGPRR